MKFFFLLNKIPFRQQSSLLRLFKLLLNVFNFLLQFIFLSKVSFTFFFFELLFEGFNFFVLGLKKKKNKKKEARRKDCDVSVDPRQKCMRSFDLFQGQVPLNMENFSQKWTVEKGEIYDKIALTCAGGLETGDLMLQLL